MSQKPNQPQELKRMNINVDARLHDRFKSATAAQGQNMTDVLLDFIQQYVAQHLAVSPRRGGRK